MQPGNAQHADGAKLTLASSVSVLRGVGPRRAAEFAAIGIHSCADLLNHPPLRYVDRGALQRIAELAPGQPATLLTRVCKASRSRRRGGVAKATVKDDTGTLPVVWFNAAYVADRLSKDRPLLLSGVPRLVEGELRLFNPESRVPDNGGLPRGWSRQQAVYASTEALNSRAIGRCIEQLLDRAEDALPETLPAWIVQKHGFPPIAEAFQQLHLPDDPADAEPARERLAFEECLHVQLAIALHRQRCVQRARAPRLPLSARLKARIDKRLPFMLTETQARSLDEIAIDLENTRPMSRLLQGDVGSGKTIVAVCAALQAIGNGVQVAVLAPTTVLTAQLHDRFSRVLEKSRVRMAMLAGKRSAADRRAVHRAAAEGAVDLIVGTHALLSEKVRFRSLGLVIIDEQQRFGVRQRIKLTQKGLTPHLLVMTATPIPRTLMMTTYGDLDVSVLEGRPGNRPPVATILAAPEALDPHWADINERLSRGQQAIVIYPLVEASEELPLRDAQSEADRLQRDVFTGQRVSLLHGRQDPATKAQAMDDFRAGRSRVLVSTTVVEVGVDVPAATVIVVFHAERFGLAQLHQLRGRVGRGDIPGRCILVSDAKTDTARRRLATLCDTDDGFRIAEADLELRGPGEMLGDRQHGVPVFRFFRPGADAPLLAAASADAREIIAADPRLARREHAALRRAVAALRAHRLPWLQAG